MASRTLTTLFTISGLLTTVAAHAALITTHATYAGPGLDLAAFANGAYNFTFGPETLPGGITFSSHVLNSNTGLGSVLGQGSYGLGNNGSFGGPAVYAGLDGPGGYMSFSFDVPVSAFGAFLNYFPDAQAAQIIGAYDTTGSLIEEWNLTTAAPITTPGGFNSFAFRGIELAQASMKEFRLTGSYILAAATADGTPKSLVNPAPEPAPLALVSAALAGALWIRQRRKY